ncbi:hypothetical protein ACREYJ_27860 [Pseudomonas kribbensis]|uniref:hypothetical protein n=1 Tax=Pseudomonas kribbensis TaxID=1628086 RepID=UPI003D784DB4
MKNAAFAMSDASLMSVGHFFSAQKIAAFVISCRNFIHAKFVFAGIAAGRDLLYFSDQ